MTSPEVLEVRALAREFAQAQLRPHAEAWDAAGAIDDAVVPQLAELGFFGMLVPEADGGMGFGRDAYLAALEELAWGEPGVALLLAQSVLAADLVARFGDAEQRGRWLGGLAAGELVGCIAFSAHPDPAHALRAEAAGETWTLRGRRSWVTNGHRADLAIVLADAGGPTLFALPRDAGLRVGARVTTLGMRSVALVDLELDGVSATAEHRLAGFDGGADPEGALGALSTAAIAVGIAQAALEHAIRYGGEREQFGAPIRSFDGIRHKLAEMATRTAAARALLERAGAADAEPTAAPMAKLLAAETAMYVTTEAVQVFGGYGYMRDYPVEKLMRDAKATQIMHGPSEVQRLRIADALHV